MKRGKRIWWSLVIVCLMLTSCGNGHGRPTHDPEIIEEVEPETTEVTMTDEESEDSVLFQGEYSLEQAQARSGVYVAYEDGSFDRYNTDGFCVGLEDSLYSFSKGMFLLDSIAAELPVIDQNTEMVLFWRGDCRVGLNLINLEATAICLNSDDGRTGYAIYDPGELVVTYTNDYSWERIDIEYLNGELYDDYSEKIVRKHLEFNPASGNTGLTLTYDLYDLPKDEPLTVGVADGTKLIETTYEVNATYYDFDEGHNNHDVRDRYGLDLLPTKEGYAKLDFSDIPAGQYVMVIYGDAYNRATLVTLQ